MRKKNYDRAVNNGKNLLKNGDVICIADNFYCQKIRVNILL